MQKLSRQKRVAIKESEETVKERRDRAKEKSRKEFNKRLIKAYFKHRELYKEEEKEIKLELERKS